ncbi:ret finger protein-like 4B [Teleopsis dalmanni]|uniref:ret finger protein-like 4B n=1 Tax=Teleopsis dalmanni TaxID=139649 RepID=UPI0018CF1DC0|nr:ret finger protein-like 4B [Teleopsis dalmanni]XP_037954652.1 ret finger protein-like 4B [Teleopsis dalmanni]
MDPPICPICLGNVQNAIVSSCNHQFCMDCYMQFKMHTEKKPPPCPLCRTEIVKIVTTMRVLNNWINTHLWKFADCPENM